MEINKNDIGLSNQKTKARTFNLTDLVLIIGYR